MMDCNVSLTAEMNSGDEFWAAVGKAALRGKEWRLIYDPWDGFVVDVSEERVLVNLKNVAEPICPELQMFLGRSHVSEETWERFALGVPFTVEFKYGDDNVFLEFDFF